MIDNVIYCKKHILCSGCPFKLILRGRLPLFKCNKGYVRKNQQRGVIRHIK